MNFLGKEWKTITEEDKKRLLSNASCIDGATGNGVVEGECIIDLTDNLSIAGKIVDDEYVIDDESIIYDPSEGIVIEK